MSLFSSIASGIATGVKIFGDLKAGSDQQKATDFNAEVSEQDAIAAKKKAKYDEEIHRERVKSFLSKQKAIIGKSGVTIEGSPLLALLDTIEKGELDALAIREGGLVESQRFRSSATQSRIKGKAIRTGSFFDAGSTLLSGLKV